MSEIVGKKIKALPEATTAADTDVMVIEDGSKTRKIGFGVLRRLLGIDTINNNLSWKKLSESAVVGSSNPVNRDYTQYRELLIVVGENTTGSNTRFVFNIPTDCLSDTMQKFRNGYYRDSSVNAFCSVGVTTSTLYVTDFNIGGTSYMSNTDNLRIVYAR